MSARFTDAELEAWWSACAADPSILTPPEMDAYPEPDKIPLANPLRPPLFYEPHLQIHRPREYSFPRYDVYDTCQPDEPRMERYPECYPDYETAVTDLLECRMRFIRELRDRMIDDLHNLQAYHRAVYGWSL